MKRWFIVLLILFLCLLPLACRQADSGSTPVSEATGEQSASPVLAGTAENLTGSFVPYESKSLGLSLLYPSGWFTHTSFSGLTLASSPTVIEEESLADLQGEAFVNIIPGEIAVYEMQLGEEFDSNDPVAVLNSYLRLLQAQGENYIALSAPARQEMNGQQMATMVVGLQVGNNDTLMTILGVVINDEYMALISAGALQESFREKEPMLRAVLESIEVSPPTNLSQ